MKTIFHIVAIALIAGLFSCQKESNLFDELTPEDQIAVEGMEEAFETSKLYNDSLIWCSDASNNCSQIFLEYCDSIFHSNDGIYETHHNNYSHNNMDDDHHHSAFSNHHHGNSEIHNESEDEQHGHNQNSHNEMNELREHHLIYHPN